MSLLDMSCVDFMRKVENVRLVALGITVDSDEPQSRQTCG